MTKAPLPPLYDWSKEKSLELIRAYKCRPALWNPKHPMYYRQTSKSDFWAEIAQELDVHPYRCKQRIARLMSTFRRHKIETLRSQNSGDPSQKYTTTWFAFNDLSFLMYKDNDSELRSIGPDTNIDEEHGPSVTKEIMNHSPQQKSEASTSQQAGNDYVLKEDIAKMISIVPPSTNVFIPDKVQFKRSKVIMKRVQDMIKVVNVAKCRKRKAERPPPGDPIPSSSDSIAVMNDRDEEIKYFTNFLAMKMKKYKVETKNAVQEALCDIMFKADQNFYENRNANLTVGRSCVNEKNYDNITEESRENQNNHANVSENPYRNLPHNPIFENMQIVDDE